jgi:hypothetical protein
MNLEGNYRGGMRGERPMQRISTPLSVTADRLGMADMIGTAGEQKAFQRMVDARIAIVWNRATGRDVYAIDNTGTNIENGGFIEENAWRFASLKRTQDNLPVAVKAQ